MNETKPQPSGKTGKMRFEGVVNILATGFERMRGDWDIEEETTDGNPPYPEDIADSPNEE